MSTHMIVHNEYDPSTIIDDIAVIQLPYPVYYTYE